MCGFVGFFNFGNKDLLFEATSMIAHRGPDNQSVYWDKQNNSGLGHRRLSIIDLSESGNQPFWNDTKELAIIFNGEIFNYLELKEELYSLGVTFKSKTDTEVLLKGFEVYGKQILNKLNGMFAFVIYNAVTKEVFAARDHMGIKPFYYYHTNNILVVASEIKSITTGIKNIQPDLNAIATPMHFQTAPQTGFMGVEKLESGMYLKFKNNRLSVKKYWSIPVGNKTNKSLEEMTFDLDVLLNKAVKRQMISDVPVGVLLSGGLDSSLIASLMSKNTNTQINSFTIKINESDLKQQGIADDSFYAKKVADKYNFKHNEILIEPDIIDILPKMVYHQEEIIVDPAAINTYLISKMAKDSGIPVLLSGIGADEIFGGYRIHKALNTFNEYGIITNNLISRRTGQLLKHIPDYLPLPTKKHTRWLKKVSFLLSLSKDERHLFAKDAALMPNEHNELFKHKFSYNELNHIKKETELFQRNHIEYLDKICLSDASIYLPDHNLNYLDKAMMAASIEGRPPLIDYKIVEFAFSCKPEFKIYQGSQKHILKQVARNYLDNEIIDRPKVPFAAPLRSWIKNELKEMVFDLLTESRIKDRGVFNYAYVNKILYEHYKGIKDHAQLILRLIMTEIWFQTFFDRK